MRVDAATLCGALVGRLTLDGRVADAVQLARLFTDTEIAALGVLDVVVAVDLAAASDSGALAGALARCLSNEGRAANARWLAALCAATGIGKTGDFGDLLPSA